jgi:YidC/Oxa1 family membrane protein insertase
MRALLLFLAAVAATAADPATAAAAPEAPVYDEVVLSSSTARVVVSTNRGVIKRFELVEQRAIRLPTHLEPYAGARRSEPPLAILDAYQPRAEDGVHGWLFNDVVAADGTRTVRVGLDRADTAPWTVAESSPERVVLTFRNPRFAYRLEHRLDAARPTLHTRLAVTNLGEAANLRPRLMPLNGLHQDYGVGEGYYLAGFRHQGGEAGGIESHSLPAAQTSAPLVATGEDSARTDYLGLKSRFFAAWWSPAERAQAPVVAGASPLDEGAAAPAAAPGDAARYTATLTGFQNLGRHETHALVVVDWEPTALAAGATLSRGWTLSASGMTKDELERFTPIERRVEYTDGFYRFFKILAKGMTWLLGMIAAVVVNYGLAVVILTFLIKAALFRTTWKQYSSMLKMQQLAPELKRLQETAGGNKQQAAMKQMELFKKHGVNPLAGCLPLLIQIPIFMALYQAFSHSADLRGVSFLWISDLTLPDQVWGTPIAFLGGWILSLNPLPIIYIAVSLWMGFQQKPAPGADEMQVQMAKMMRWLPAIFGLIFYNMPSGLVLYFTVQAIISTVEIKYIKRKLGMP